MSLHDVVEDATRKIALVSDEMVSEETRELRRQKDPLEWANERIDAIDHEIERLKAWRRELVKERRQLLRKGR